MDLERECKDKLAFFRVKELKEVLTQVGLSRQGKKQDLADRILAVFSDEHVSKTHGWGKKNSLGKEGVAKLIDDTFRTMQGLGATDLASKSHSGSDLSRRRPKDEVADSRQLDIKVRCPCASSLFTDSMIKCEDPLCQVWQHIGCVIIPECPLEGVPPEIPSHFYCEICRIKRADPFWVTIGQPLLSLKLTSSGTAADGKTTVQNLDRTFQLPRPDRELLQKNDYALQAWCILLNDKVPFRMQWPQYVDLQVNGVSCRTTNRPGSQLLGINGRDDGSVISTFCREGVNKICLSRCDARVFCFGIRIAKKRTFSQVFSLIPKEAKGEQFEDALTRVRRCIGGGTAKENADDDSDLEVVADSVTVNLRCPMSGSRIRVAGRFKPCIHMGCFDLESFVELNQRARKWQCPICLKNYSVDDLIIDPYFNRITCMMRKCTEDMNEIDIKPDGSWRAKGGADFWELAQWHFPDGSICPTVDVDVKPDLEVSGQIKREATSSEGRTGLKIGIKKNRNGMWQVSKPGDLQAPSSLNHSLERFESRPDVVPLSSSGTGSYRDGEDASVNQDGGHFDFSASNGHEHNSFTPNFDPTYNLEDRIVLASSKDADIIVLSDSEDEIVSTSPITVYEASAAAHIAIPFSADVHGFSEGLSEDPGLGTSEPSCVSLFNNNVEDFGPIWPMQSDAGFELFTTAANHSDDVLGAPVGGFGFASEGGLGDGSQVQNTEVHEILVDNHVAFGNEQVQNTEMNEILVDNPLAFCNDDPSLEFFLPTGSSSVSLQADLSDLAEIPNGDHSDSSRSLSGHPNYNDSVPTDELNLIQQPRAKENELLLLNINGDRTKKALANDKRVRATLHPRQPRSVRPRPCPSIDSDSS